MHKKDDPLATGKVHRCVGAAFGIFLLGVAALVFVTADASNRIGAMVAALVLAALGANAVLAAVRSRRSWLSRIGPLP